ncbi:MULTISPECIES: helix-turn-helix domain-containing protein [Thioclava]|uniref:Helix-turn-helix domain-containing protein n=1 Tax=Thioclava kandeliae TaxID=3070818 RepID=A0ABV1SLG1_9RHOB
MSALFDTSQIETQNRFAYWNDLVFKNYAPCMGRAPKDEEFSATLEALPFGQMMISRVASSPITYERRLSDVRYDPRDDFFAVAMLSGRTMLVQNGHETWARPGDIYLYSSARPYQHHSDADYRCVSLRIPRALAQARLTQLDDITGRVLKGDTPYGRILSSLIVEASEISAQGDREQALQGFSTSVLDMMTAAIGASFGAESCGSRNQRLLSRIQHYMRDNLADSGLGLAEIATAQNVSMRTLARLFTEAGTTPMAWLQSQRLACAYAALNERRVESVSEAAFAYGFNDSSYFGKAFKKTYGITPKTLLERN